MVTGKTVGGTVLYGNENRLERLEALNLYTHGSAKFSREENQKGTLAVGMYADMAVLSEDYFSIPEDTIKDITSILTILGGKVVYSANEFAKLDQSEPLPVSVDWSPVRFYGGYYHSDSQKHCSCQGHHPIKKSPLDILLNEHQHPSINPWSFGCDCFAY